MHLQVCRLPAVGVRTHPLDPLENGIRRLQQAGSRLQASEALVMRLMSASIAATALMTEVRAAISPRVAAERHATPELA
jgi:hypothetical protein